MFTIQLQNLHLYGYHGMHAEERLMGANFEVEMSIDIDVDENIEHLNDTLDYVTVYQTIRKYFEQPYPFLENLATDIVAGVRQIDDRIKRINITISKLNAPIANFKGKVGISFTKQF